MNAATFRKQLADADFIGAAIAHAARTANPFALENLAHQLQGTARLAMHLRNAILTAPAGAESTRDADQWDTAA